MFGGSAYGSVAYGGRNIVDEIIAAVAGTLGYLRGNKLRPAIFRPGLAR